MQNHQNMYFLNQFTSLFYQPNLLGKGNKLTFHRKFKFFLFKNTRFSAKKHSFGQNYRIKNLNPL